MLALPLARDAIGLPSVAAWLVEISGQSTPRGPAAAAAANRADVPMNSLRSTSSRVDPAMGCGFAHVFHCPLRGR